MKAKLVRAPDTIWVRVRSFQLMETARQQRPVSQAEVSRRALEEGLAVLERNGTLERKRDLDAQ